jgi:hypothetical protein
MTGPQSAYSGNEKLLMAAAGDILAVSFEGTAPNGRRPWLSVPRGAPDSQRTDT